MDMGVIRMQVYLSDARSTDRQIITEALRAHGRELVPVAGVPDSFKIVDSYSPADRELASMNARVYAMNEADRSKWYAEHPLKDAHLA